LYCYLVVDTSGLDTSTRFGPITVFENCLIRAAISALGAWLSCSSCLAVHVIL